MLKFVVVLTIALAAIPSTIGEVDLPPLALECVEDHRIYYPMAIQADFECHKRLPTCQKYWQLTDPFAVKVKEKCRYSKLGLSEAQLDEYEKRLGEIAKAVLVSLPQD